MAICSVIIPTHNNEHVVACTLRALFSQTVPPGWGMEVLLVDDGSHDATCDIARALSPPAGWRVHILPAAHAGAAAARNRGIAASTGEIVLLLGGDILLQPGGLAAHINFHTQHADETAAALGYIVWDPTLPPSPLMEWMNHGGHQNSYDELLGHTVADPTRYFYGSNLSLKRTLLQGEQFSPIFSGYGWEDLELGRRLQQRGLTLQLLFTARGFHHHVYSIDDFCRRQRAVGQGLVQYQALYPNLELLPPRRPRQYVKYYLGRYSGVLWGCVRYAAWQRHRSLPRLYAAISALYLWEGIIKGRRTPISSNEHKI